MSRVIVDLTRKQLRKIGVSALCMLAFAVLAMPVAAQQQGPLPPPPGTVVVSSAPAEASRTNSSPQVTSSHISNEPPAVPVEQIIQKFTQHEEEFRKERENYT